jgi:hypothetical protein
LNEDERKQILAQAETSHLTVSEFLRRRALGKQIVSKADLLVLNELRRLGGLLKHIHLETRGAYSEDTRNAIRALEDYAGHLKKKIKENVSTKESNGLKGEKSSDERVFLGTGDNFSN